ncbi:pyridoxamine 5'-phosphate oxidase family protein [Kitasatospora terrestris]|uniref:Pyridoxamine 5'-phosphate oxidase family protein n=1 Tax=Kitasatospora terrestris TaxID=258051 RepID=A0ABP9EPW2_9ACTN
MTAENTLSGPRSLDENECYRFLSAAAVGRVVYTVGALPAVLPVRYRIAGDGGVLLPAPAAELARAVVGALVAFEAGEVSGEDGSGWSVTVLGHAEAAAAPAAAAGEPGAAAAIRIRPELVTGRLLGAGPPALGG